MTNLDAGLIMPGNIGRIPGRENMAHVTPRFYSEQRKADGVDPATGLPRFIEVEFVELIIAGDRGSAAVKRVTPEIKRQWADAYARWKSGQVSADMIGDGIPLALWPTCQPGVVEGLRYINVFTVQQLAGIADTALTQPGMLGLRDLRDKARAFIESAKTTAPIARLEVENDDLKKRLELMTSQMKDMAEKYDAIMAQQGDQVPTPTPRKRRGNEEEG